MPQMYSKKSKQAFGAAIKRFIESRNRADEWPDSLKLFYENVLEAHEKQGNKLTYSAYVEWLGSTTGWEILTEKKSHQKYVKKVYHYVSWERDPGNTGGDDFILISAICACKAALDEEGRPYTSVDEIVKMLSQAD